MNQVYLTAKRYWQLETRLSERDLEVIRRVAGLRFVSGQQLTRLCFADGADQLSAARTARRVLLRLTSLGVLNRLNRRVGGVRAGSAGFVYYLGPYGQRMAVARDWQPERRIRRSLEPGTLFVRHSLAISELHTRLIETDRSARFELLELTPEPSCWRSFDGLGGQRQTLKPDSYVRLGLGDYEDSYFIELDRGSEGSRALNRQLESYIAYHRSGAEQAQRGVFPRVLWLVPSEQRKAAVVDCLARLPAESWQLFQVSLLDAAIATITKSETLDSPKQTAEARGKIYE
ncbi:MAG: replication-relaxation family protein [Solirubrobacteraceae bacterium]